MPGKLVTIVYIDENKYMCVCVCVLKLYRVCEKKLTVIRSKRVLFGRVDVWDSLISFKFNYFNFDLIAFFYIV